MKNLKIIKLEEQFLHILRNRVSRDERSVFFSELENDPAKKKAFMAFEKMWVINNMAHRSTASGLREKKFSQFWKETHKRAGLQLWQYVSGIAAVILVTLLLSELVVPALWHPAPKTMVFVAPKGNISQVTLDDGSTIWLNSSSKAVITNYANKKVNVNLEGEAFFDVKHDESRAFLVQTGKYQIHDKGTRFNVKYDVEKKELSTALFEGAIEFRKGEQVLLNDLKPGTMFNFNMTTHEVSTAIVDREFVTAWKDGKFVFVNKTLGEIAAELEEWYDAKFVFRDESVKTEKFSGVIKRRTSMEHLLKVLKLSSQMDYSIEDMDDGSCTVYFE